MASHKSAAKRAKQSIRRNAENRSYLSKVKTLAKAFYTTVGGAQTGSVDSVKLQEQFKSVQSAIQKAVGKGRITRNKAARSISRMATAVAKIVDKK